MLYDDIRGALPTLQEHALSGMGDTFAAYSPSGTSTAASGLQTRVYAAEGTTLGKIQSRSGGAGSAGDATGRTVLIGGVERVVMEAGLHIPLDAPLPTGGKYGVGWEYECLAVGPGSDPNLVGRRYLVVEVPAKTYATARRLDVVEI